MDATSTERRAEPGEVCTCGRPAVTVYVSPDGTETGYCGAPAPAPGPCLWCGDRHEGRCPQYRIRP